MNTTNIDNTNIDEAKESGGGLFGTLWNYIKDLITYGRLKGSYSKLVSQWSKNYLDQLIWKGDFVSKKYQNLRKEAEEKAEAQKNGKDNDAKGEINDKLEQYLEKLKSEEEKEKKKLEANGKNAAAIIKKIDASKSEILKTKLNSETLQKKWEIERANIDADAEIAVWEEMKKLANKYGLDASIVDTKIKDIKDNLQKKIANAQASLKKIEQDLKAKEENMDTEAKEVYQKLQDTIGLISQLSTIAGNVTAPEKRENTSSSKMENINTNFDEVFKVDEENMDTETKEVYQKFKDTVASLEELKSTIDSLKNLSKKESIENAKKEENSEDKNSQIQQKFQQILASVEDLKSILAIQEEESETTDDISIEEMVDFVSDVYNGNWSEFFKNYSVSTKNLKFSKKTINN